MIQPAEQNVVALVLCEEKFQFRVAVQTADVLEGFFVWTDIEKARLHEVMATMDDEKEWYLDDDGFRLADDALFEKSPWTLIDRGIATKVVQKFMDSNSGESRFCLTPWFRIGDELNQRPPDRI